MVLPPFNDVVAARQRISRYLQPTALNRYPALDELIGTETWVKHENNQPVCAFKVRGGINLLSQLTDDARRRGVITASTGNHGQSIAYAARIFGVRAIVCVPEGANPVKVRSIRGLGAEIVTQGLDFDDAREHAAHLAEEHGYRYIHSGNEPYLIAGVGTQALEILERQPDIEVIIVPIGGGSGAAGGRHRAQGSTQRQADGADPQRLQRYAGPTSRASRPTLTSPASRGGKLNLTALEDDDRNLALCQGLLLLDVGHEALELFPLFGTSGPRAGFELVGTHLDRRDRTREQILVPARM